MRECLASTRRTSSTSADPESAEGGTPEQRVNISGLHIHYHLVALVLHRHVNWKDLGAERVAHCVRETHARATQVLELVHQLDQADPATVIFSRMARSCPLASLAITSAIDVMTAAGAMSDVLGHQDEGGQSSFTELMTFGLEALDDLGKYWRTAKIQSDWTEARLKAILTHSRDPTKKAFFFREPVHNPFGLDRDVVYGLSRFEYLQILGVGHRVRKHSDLMEIETASSK